MRTDSIVAAVISDDDNRKAIDHINVFLPERIKYDDICSEIRQELLRMGVKTDVVSQDADWSSYKVLIAPMMYLLHDETSVKIKSFVAKGGTILATYFMGYEKKNQSECWDEMQEKDLAEVFGFLRKGADIFDASECNGIIWSNGARIRTQVRDYAEILEVQDAEVLAVFEDDYYAGCAAITKKCYGQGKAYYVAGKIAACDLWSFFERIFTEAGIVTSYLEENI